MPRFIVKGVDKESGFDTELIIDAESAANAKVKAELKGMIVTESMDTMKPCPFCAEENLNTAAVCKRCGEYLRATPPPISNPAPTLAVTKRSKRLGCVFHGVFIVLHILAIAFLFVALFITIPLHIIASLLKKKEKEKEKEDIS